MPPFLGDSAWAGNAHADTAATPAISESANVQREVCMLLPPLFCIGSLTDRPQARSGGRQHHPIPAAFQIRISDKGLENGPAHGILNPGATHAHTQSGNAKGRA